MKYGFIGLGNMAGAIIAGMAACGKFKNDYLYGFNRSQGKTLALKEKHGLIPCASAAEVAEKADVIILAVKPQVLPEVMPRIKPLSASPPARASAGMRSALPRACPL